MKILVTGKNGFIAKNVIEYFTEKNHEVLCVSHTDPDEVLEQYSKDCDFVFHLAAVQRSTKEQDFWEGNVKYTEKLISFLEKSKKVPPILFTTSTGIDTDSTFSITKKEAERRIREYGKNNDKPVYIYKLNHIFGKYGKPNFNNVVSTFCYNYMLDLPISVSDTDKIIYITYIDDLLNDFNKSLLKDKPCDEEYLKPSIIYKITLGGLLSTIKNIENEKDNELAEKLKSTCEYFGEYK